MSQERKEKRYVQLPKPKHAEEYSLRESMKWQPWKVTLKVQLHEEDPEPVDYDVYLRADTPDNASYTCYQVFYIWEHVKRPDRLTEYPKISTDVPSEAEKIDEDVWESEWKLVQKLGTYLSAGDPRNPTIFRYVPQGWDIPKGVARPDMPSILVPDTADMQKIVAKVNATKNRA